MDPLSIYQKFRLVSAGEKARWKKKEKERRTIDTIVDKATHRETRRLMLFSHLSAKNPTRPVSTSRRSINFRDSSRGPQSKHYRSKYPFNGIYLSYIKPVIVSP